ncbi:dirigent protein 21 [Canna indica]|uniref:Dirigent protein n=1 Tax=Canna indica TaxID=4628 RepID=A0AAQ3KY45_9LILI|nr:dirigent protein 21 [Canna indica]
MASSSLSLLAILVALLALAAEADKNTTHIHFFLHNNEGGLNPTVVKVVGSRSQSSFGGIYVFDDPLTEGPDLASKLIGRAQGSYVVAAQDPSSALLVTANLVFTERMYNGSTLALLSRLSFDTPVAELSVV